MISRVDSSVALSLGSLILGSGLTFALEAVRHRRTRSEAVHDARRLERSQAYVDFLNSAHDAAHLLGRATPGCPNPLDRDSASYWRLDSDVARRLRVIEILGSDHVTETSRRLRTALDVFRTATTRPDMVYDTPEYWDAYKHVTLRRKEFIDAARQDLRAVV
jgi:hypothetical protein